MQLFPSWLAKKVLIWQNLRNESLEGKNPVWTCPVSTEAAVSMVLQEDALKCSGTS